MTAGPNIMNSRKSIVSPEDLSITIQKIMRESIIETSS
jgi:hypothetical protein